MTIAVEAARNALQRCGADPKRIGAIYVGSESHPYAVKPTSTIVAEAIGAVPNTQAADWQFAILPTTDQHVLSVAVGRTAGDAVRISSRAVVPQDL